MLRSCRIFGINSSFGVRVSIMRRTNLPETSFLDSGGGQVKGFGDRVLTYTLKPEP